MILAVETILLCLVFWGMCWLGTGTDEKNIKSFSSYPDEVQELVKQNEALAPKIKTVSPVVSFLSNFVMFTIVLGVLGYFVKGEGFLPNFLHVLLMGEVLNLFDLLVMDLLWCRHTKRIRFSGTQDDAALYQNPKKHIMAFVRAIFLFLLVAVADGLILMVL